MTGRNQEKSVKSSDKDVETTPGQSETESRAGWHLLKGRDFGFLFAGQAISQIGDGLNKVALLWFVYELTGSALKTTLIGLLQTLPPLVLGPLLGVYLDRWPKKRVMVWVDVARTLLVLLIPLLFAVDVLTLPLLYVLVFVTAVFSTVFGPALASAIPFIVARGELTSANALLQTTTNLGVLIGPVISGLGIALVGAQNVLYANAVTFLISVFCLLPIRIREQRRQPAHEATQGALVQELAAGFRFTFIQNRTIFALMLTSGLYTLGMSAFVFLLPVVAKQVLHIGPAELGWLWSALGGGMLLSSTWLACTRQGLLSARFRLLAVSLGIGGLAVCSLGAFQSVLLSAGLVILIGCSSACFMPVVWSVLQELTPEHMLGRVFTMFSTGGMASAMAGMGGFGWAADALSTSASLMGVGMTLLGAATLAAHFSLRHADQKASLALSSQVAFRAKTASST
jgi:DHA3 family macrolide efflux protein-like MFS transporter